MNNAKKLIDDSVKEVRTISHNLMPAGLMDKGIEFALNELANKINDTGLLHIDLMITESEQRLDSSVEIAIYRIVQEVVNNMIKHSKANKVEVLLDYNTEKIYLSIKDNGLGFDTNTIEQSSGIGWKNIFSRVYMMNGDVQVNSQPGRGTLVNIEFAK
jgi:signal transduction histidine kinase